MRIFFMLIYFAMTLISCQLNEANQTLIATELSDEKAVYQQQIVSHLSGASELSNNVIMRSRWSEKERELASKYLKELLLQLNIEPQEQNYISANLNPAIDLLFGPYRGTNVFGILPSSQPTDEYIILGAHYDTGKRNVPGAIDNG